MSRKNIWNLKFIAGNPQIFNKVRTGTGSPMGRAQALEEAEIINSKGWRGWVEHENTGERIYETDVEKQFISTSQS